MALLWATTELVKEICLSQAQDNVCERVRDSIEIPRRWGREVGGGFRMGNTLHPWLIHVNERQKPRQYRKVISLQLKKKKEQKKKKKNVSFSIYRGRKLKNSRS